MERRRILIVDDLPDNISVLNEALRDLYTVIAATTGEKALHLAEANPPPDIILLDVMMPDMDGYEICRFLKENPLTRDIPVIFITARNQIEDETRGLEIGAVDFLSKPAHPAVVQTRVKAHLQAKEAREYLEKQAELMEERVVERTRELELTWEATLLSLSALAEARDNETGEHILRTKEYMEILAREYAENYPGSLTEQEILLIKKTSPLHDVGKVSIRDSILLKPGPLTHEEFGEMKLHTIYGDRALTIAEDYLKGIKSPYLTMARLIALNHHERWDGKGYPNGKSRDEIPLPARLMTMADTYDALISRRVYKPPFSHRKARQIIRESSGLQLDPAVVLCFEAKESEFLTVAAQFAEDQEAREILFE